MRPARLALILPALAACTQFPSLDSAVDPAVFDAPPPALVPLETVTGTGPAPRATTEDQAALAARAAALNRRARGLGGPVIDPPTLRRFDRGVTLPTPIREALERAG